MITLRATADQHARLKTHLVDGSGLESLAVGLLGQTADGDRKAYMVHEIIEIPNADCTRTPVSIQWPTARLKSLLARARADGLAILKIHSHPTGHPQFSDADDGSDRELFSAAALKAPGPHVSAIMLPCGTIKARTVDAQGAFRSIDRIAIVGDDLIFWPDPASVDDTFDKRHRQLFGNRTADLLRSLSVAVVGVSGTGSATVEMLVRLGVGRIVLIDFDRVELRNLNRIWGSIRQDAEDAVQKVDMMHAYIERIGLGTDVVTHTDRIDTADAIALLSTCDILLGCVDSLEGRDTLNRLCAYYTLPYIDVGVRLDADGEGGVASVSAAVHYLKPGGSSLKSRGVYTDDALSDEYIKRTDPDHYEDLLRRGYIRGVRVDSPAVISVNTLAAATAVNELLARLHPFRTRPNREFAVQKLLLSHGRTIARDDGAIDASLAEQVGRGDCRPLLGSGRIG